VEKRKAIDSGTRESKRSRPNNQPSRFREEHEEDTIQKNTKRTRSRRRSCRSERYKNRSYANRLLNCLLISPAGRSIKGFSSVKEILTALCDAIKANILHRDISENNIIITDTDPQTANGFTGILIDLDLAIVNGNRTGSQHQTGTVEFMAIDVLLGVEHTYRHDLESFFYILL
jgi:serine/threonine protein kinase